MSPAATESENSTPSPAPLADFRLPAIILFLSLAAYGTWTTPIPGINEPHYLGKAKHFWNPDWCARDLFLQSADAHWFFYATFGTITRVLTLEQTAWVGRLMIWGFLAWGWVRLGAQVFSSPWGPVGAMWLYLAWFSSGNVPEVWPLSLGWIAAGSFSGEWLVGGVESKGFAFGFLFLALAEASARRWNRAAAYCGLSISFHPVVGGWGAIAGAIAILARRREIQHDSLCDAKGAHRVLVPPLLCGLLALPGLIPALAMLADAPSREISETADRIQVFDRLDHHLDPLKFDKHVYAAYGLLLAAWVIGRRYFRLERAERFFFPFVSGTVLIALAGLAIGFGPRWPGLMKYYLFREFDAFLPLAGATLFVECLSLTHTRRIICSAISAAALASALTQPTVGQNPGGWKDRAHWPAFVEACRWIDANMPANALFLTPRYNFGFKWYAQRAEYVAYKDVPQDAANIMEWKRRLDQIAAWRQKHVQKGFDADAVAELHDGTGIEFVLAWKAAEVDPYRIAPIYQNRSFAVYLIAK